MSVIIIIIGLKSVSASEDVIGDQKMYRNKPNHAIYEVKLLNSRQKC